MCDSVADAGFVMGTIQVGGATFAFDPEKFIDISIPLHFNGPQPNAYGVERARARPCEAGALVGDTRRGGSVNFEQYTFIPHCSGTHTECVGHITHERISVRDCLKDVFILARLVTAEPEQASETDESFTVVAGDNDRVITRKLLLSAIGSTTFKIDTVPDMALILRTLPNDDTKLTRDYSDNIPPYFSTEAIEYIVECGFKHLLVDIPSIDRIFDEGKLVNHRLFWNVEAGSHEVNDDSRFNSTITELIYVPNEIADGEYLLNLQIAPFASDCAPSRPVLFKTI